MWFMNSEPNDCSVCAVLNILKAININISKEEVKQATRYNCEGGHPDTGLKIIADKLKLQSKYYPKYDDLIWTKHLIKENVTWASPELNKHNMFEGCKNLLRDGWVAVTTIRWENTDNYHAVSLVDIQDNLIKVVCSLKGMYLADENFFKNKKGNLNGGVTTFWVTGGSNENK